MSVTHVAGPVVFFGKADRVIQRCAVCGDMLTHIRPSRIAVLGKKEVTIDDLPHFGEGRLITVVDGNPRQFTDVGGFADNPDLPDDFCLELVEEYDR